MCFLGKGVGLPAVDRMGTQIRQMVYDFRRFLGMVLGMIFPTLSDDYVGCYRLRRWDRNAD